MILVKEELIDILTQHHIEPYRYTIKEYNDSLIYHNDGKYYTPTFYFYFGNWDYEPSEITNKDLIKLLISKFNDPTKFIYFILSENKTINLGGYFSLSLYDKKLERIYKTKKLLSKTKDS